MTTAVTVPRGGRGAAAVADSVTALLEPRLLSAGFDLVAVEVEALRTPAAVVRVLLDRVADHPLGPRIDLDGVADATRIVDAVLDADPELIPGRYSLEVSSPGLERPLRTPAHFRAALGRTVAVRTRPGTPGERRVEGMLEAADVGADGGLTIAGITVAYGAVERARTVVDWGPAPKPGSPGARGRPVTPARPGPTASRAGRRVATVTLPGGTGSAPAREADAPSEPGGSPSGGASASRRRGSPSLAPPPGDAR